MATAQGNQQHALLLGYGIASLRGTGALLARVAASLEDGDNELPDGRRALLRELGDELRHLEARVREFDWQIEALARRMPAERLMTIPGIGDTTATALVAAVGVPRSSAMIGSWRRGWGWCRGSTRQYQLGDLWRMGELGAYP